MRVGLHKGQPCAVPHTFTYAHKACFICMQTCHIIYFQPGDADGGWTALGAASVEPVHTQPAFHASAGRQAAAARAHQRSWDQIGTFTDEAAPDTVMLYDVNNAIPARYDADGTSNVAQIMWDARVSTGVWPWEAGYNPDTALGAPPGGAPRHYTDDMVQLGMNWASAKGDCGENSTGWRAFKEFCADEKQPHDRPLDPNTYPLWVLLREETFAMQFVCSLVEKRGVQVSTVKSYFSQVQSRHRRKHGVKLAAGLKLERLPDMLKGLERFFGKEPPKIRRGIAPQELRRAMDLLLDPRVPEHANMRAALSLALQGLLRSAEYTINPGTAWRQTKNLNRADIKRLDLEMLVMMMHPCKNMLHLGGKTCPLIIGAGGEYIDAVSEMRNLMRVDPVDSKADTPLFRHPADGTCITTDEILGMFKKLMNAIGDNPLADRGCNGSICSRRRPYCHSYIRQMVF